MHGTVTLRGTLVQPYHFKTKDRLYGIGAIRQTVYNLGSSGTKTPIELGVGGKVWNPPPVPRFGRGRKTWKRDVIEFLSSLPDARQYLMDHVCQIANQSPTTSAMYSLLAQFHLAGDEYCMEAVDQSVVY